jgi:hypothetical protein
MQNPTSHPIPSILLDAMPAAGADGLVEIPIAITGAWKRGEIEFSITKEDLARMAANFKRRKNGEINVDYDHASEMPEVAKGGPVPSAGRIVGMRSNGALHASIEFTARALELIKAKEYRFVSPAIAWGVKDKATGEDQGTTLTSLALTNRPFLEELPPIRLSEIGSEGSGPGSGPGEETMSNATREFVRLAEARAKEDAISFREALGLVSREMPELCNEYRCEVVRGQTVSEAPPEKEKTTLGPAQAEFIRLAHEKAKRDGIRFSDAILSVGRERPSLADAYRREIIDDKL